MKVFNSIRFKLLFLALFAVFAITSLVVWSDIEDTKERLISVQKEKAMLLSDIIKQSIMILMIENRWKELQSLITDLLRDNNELKEVRIFHPVSGRVIVSGESSDVGKLIYKDDWDKFRRQESSPFVIAKGGLIYATKVTPIKNAPPCHRCHAPGNKVLGVLDVEVSLAVAQDSIKDMTYKHLMGVGIAFIVISMIFLIGGERLIDRPLRRLTDAMKGVEAGDLSTRTTAHGRDEFGYLSSVFNGMIGSLESAKKELDSCHTKQMERASQLASLGEIVSGIAHEIKNPLAGISCAVQVFRSELDEGDNRRVVITEILNQVNRLDRIVKDLLSYAKPKPPQFLPSKISELIEKALFFVYTEAKKQAITIETRIEEGLPEVSADPDQMQQVFLNIIINAVQAMSSGGTLLISASGKTRQEIQDVAEGRLGEGNFLCVRFQDTGKGIAPEDLEYIFEPFFTRKSRGTGLGLSISQKIVQEHGGTLAVASELGKGSIFTIYLPVKEKIKVEEVKR